MRLLVSAGNSGDIAAARVNAARGLAHRGRWIESQAHTIAAMADTSQWIEPETVAEAAELHAMYGDPAKGQQQRPTEPSTSFVSISVAGAADQESKKEIDPHDLVFMSASELALKIQSRQVTSVEVVEAYLAQIAKYNGKLNAIVTLDIEGARQRAKEADAALARGEILGAAAWRSHNDQRQHRRRGDENHQQFARPCQLCAGL